MKTVILGAGVSGLAAAVQLSECGIETEIIEATALAGGRIAAVKLKGFGETDLGQHAISSAYENLFMLMRKVGENLSFDDKEKISIEFRDENGRLGALNFSKTDNPANLIIEFVKTDFFSIKEKILFAKFLLFVKTANPSKYKNRTTLFLFEKYRQKTIAEKFWNKFLLSVFNTSPEKVCAALFIKTVKKMFFQTGSGFSVIVLKRTLNEAITVPVINFLGERKNVVFSFSEKVTGIGGKQNRITKIITGKRKITDFDYVISALPPEKLAEILPDKNHFTGKLKSFEYSPILTAYIKLKEKNLPDFSISLPKSFIDWIFVFENYVSVVVSAAKNFAGIKKETTKKEIIRELSKFFPVFSEENILDFVLVNKKKSTIMSDNRNYKLREQIVSPYENLFLAGDWTGTEFPPTIENAVYTGFRAAKKICSLSL